MYADDMVLLSEKETDLQDMLDTLNEWCRQWRINVNKGKSRIVHFRPKNSSKSEFNFAVGPLSIEYAQSYKYLGVTFFRA